MIFADQQRRRQISGYADNIKDKQGIDLEITEYKTKKKVHHCHGINDDTEFLFLCDTGFPGKYFFNIFDNMRD